MYRRRNAPIMYTLGIANQDPIAGGKWTVRSSDSSGVDYELLKRQDEPILFYDEFLFYQV